MQEPQGVPAKCPFCFKTKTLGMLWIFLKNLAHVRMCWSNLRQFVLVPKLEAKLYTFFSLGELVSSILQGACEEAILVKISVYQITNAARNIFTRIFLLKFPFIRICKFPNQEYKMWNNKNQQLIDFDLATTLTVSCQKMALYSFET